jgi:hypothetical protein
MNQPPERERSRRPRRDFVALMVASLALYLVMLGFGIKIIGDEIGRSSLMSGIIVVLAGMAYLSFRRNTNRDG